MTALAPSVAAEQALETLAAGSRSFWFAGQFLPAGSRADAAMLYAFCRLVDDTADSAPHAGAARDGLRALDEELEGRRVARPEVARLLEVARRRSVDLRYAHELIEGVRSDLDPVRVEDDRALLRYCYRVASTVGLMMCGVIGVTAAEALPFAIDLGVAMQLTNIARDVAEDARIDRVYLPARRLAAQGVERAEPARVLEEREAVRAVVAELLGLAERYYRSADAGLRFIPLRTRLAIAIAARVYRAIGLRLLRQGGDPLNGRTVVPGWEKVLWMFAAITLRLRASWSRAAHDATLHEHLRGLPGADEGHVSSGER